MVISVVLSGTPPHQFAALFQFVFAEPVHSPGCVTLIINVSVKPLAAALQLSSFIAVIVYEVVEAGDTLTVIDGAVPLKSSPLLKEPLIVPLPDTVIVNEALSPEQTNDGPLSVAVGGATTVTVVIAVS